MVFQEPTEDQDQGLRHQRLLCHPGFKEFDRPAQAPGCDPLHATTLAEIFLNYNCNLSAVNLFSHIVNALGKVVRVVLSDATGSSGAGMGGRGAAGLLQFVAGAGAARVEMTRLDHPKLQLAAMKALQQVLASLHLSIVIPVNGGRGDSGDISLNKSSTHLKSLSVDEDCNKHNKGVNVKPTKEDALGEG